MSVTMPIPLVEETPGVASITYDLSIEAKRMLLAGFALNGLAAASGVNVPTDEVVRKAVSLADTLLRELARRKP